ncbi:MAG: DUF3422 family protein [Kiloniellaceae bacterium]
MPSELRDHPLRHALTQELHARPFARIEAPQRVTHLAMLSGEGAAEAERSHVARLCARFGAAAPGPEATHFMVDLGPLRFKWERHTEFSTYTFFQRPDAAEPEASSPPFDAPAIAQVPKDWLRALPGDLLVGIHLAMVPRATPPRTLEALAQLFGSDNIAGSLVSGGAASVWMDFTIHDDGFGRILVHDRDLRPRQAGRLVQRLLEIETYRMMALLALPVARRFGAELTEARDRLTGIVGQIQAISSLEDERRLLENLTELSAQIEGVAASAVYRFGAARAYYALVRRRVEELREARIEGLQTIHEFLDRRLAPAMRTCEAVADRLARITDRISRTGELLRTRVDIQLEAQNSALLRSMNRRARLQLRLQQTVEGLSVAAISYYLVGLVGYAAKAAKAAGAPLEADLVAGLAIPVVVGLVAYGVWRLRRSIRHDVDRSGG